MDDKIVPYGLEHLPANELHPDVRYQRPFHKSIKDKIVKNFDIKALDPLMVNLRDDGKYYVIRGQHRLSALRELFGDTVLVPCIVYIGLSHEEEAQLFYSEDMLRKRVRPEERWLSRIEGNEPLALEITAMAEEVGWALNPSDGPASKNTIRAVGAVERVVRRHGIETGKLALMVLRYLTDTQPKSTIINALGEFVHLYRSDPAFTIMEAGQSISRTPIEEIEDNARRRRTVERTPLEHALVKEFVFEFNKKKRESNRLQPYEVQLILTRGKNAGFFGSEERGK